MNRNFKTEKLIDFQQHLLLEMETALHVFDNRKEYGLKPLSFELDVKATYIVVPVEPTLSQEEEFVGQMDYTVILTGRFNSQARIKLIEAQTIFNMFRWLPTNANIADWKFNIETSTFTVTYEI